MITAGHLECRASEELAAAFVLGALTRGEAEQVRDHLATCERVHPEFAELGGVVPYLAELADPIDAPAGLKERVLGAVAADAAASREAAAARPEPRPTTLARAAPVDLAERRERRDRREQFARRMGTAWRTWALPAAAVLVIAALGAWNVSLQGQVSDGEARLAIVRDAVAVSASPGARVARMNGTGAAQGASGFAAFRADGRGYLVISGLPAAPTGHGYEAWYLQDDGTPVPAGMLTVALDGLGVLDGMRTTEATAAIALTIEVAAGVDRPTGDPVVVAPISDDAVIGAV